MSKKTSRNLWSSICLLLSTLAFPSCKSMNVYTPEQVAPSDFIPELQLFFPEFFDAKNKEIGGDCSVILFPNNTCMVIDSFMKEAGPQLVEYLKSLGIGKIDYLVVSHFHDDHIGSFPELIENFEIGTVYTSGGHTCDPTTQPFLDSLNAHNLTETILQEGDEVNISGCNFKVFSPTLDEQFKYDLMYNPGKTARLINNSSLVFKLTYGNFSMLFTGDVNQNHDKELVAKYGDQLHANVLKVPHHADYYTASSKPFIKAVKPELGIIMDNRFVNRIIPIIKVRYKKQNVPLLWLNESGVINIQADKNNYFVYF